jgi:hypothetical protein
VKAMHGQGAIGSYEAAAFEKTKDGKVKITKTVDPYMDWGAGIGAVTGAVVAVVFPPAFIGLGVGVLATALAGGVLGAVAGDLSSDFGRGTVKLLGDKLDAGTFGVVVVANAGEKVTGAALLPGADGPTRKPVKGRKALAEYMKAQEAKAAKAKKDKERAAAARARAAKAKAKAAAAAK